MTSCPRCREELPASPSDKCSHCGQSLSDPHPDTRVDATVDLPFPSTSASPATTLDTSDASTTQEPSATLDVPMNRDLSEAQDVSLDRGSSATLEPSEPQLLSQAGNPSDNLNVQWIQQTWAGGKTSSAPNMTIKTETEPSRVAPQPTLAVRNRELRKTDADTLSVADYDLIDQLGEGGMGVVYTARQASIDRTVAVKMLKPQTAQDEAQKQKFLSEAVVTGELDHPNIVPIYELGRNSDGSLFYSMKKVQGIPWMDVLPDKTLAENIEILMKVADAVAFAHSRGVVHRDLKPENVMLGAFGEVLVLDWGLALTTDQCQKSMHMNSPVGMGGTPCYMAPEMVLGPVENIGPHSDIYLLGAILYECVTGCPPHQGKTAMMCLISAGKNEIVPATEPNELIGIALNAMATEPADRFPTVQLFQQAIRTYQSHSESIALANRAALELKQAETEDDYQLFARALYVFEEACSLWPENENARAGVSKAKLAYAESAYRKEDFDLGLSIIDRDLAEHVELSKKLAKAQRDRNARQQRLRNAKRAIGLLACLVFLAVTSGMLLFHYQKTEADRQRAIAESNQREAERQRIVAAQQRDEAERQRRFAETNAEEAKRQERTAVEQRHRAEQSEQVAVEKREMAEYEAYIAWIGLADSKIQENALGQARNVLQQCSPALRDWEWYRLMFQCRQGLSRIQVGERLDCVAVNRNGSMIAAGGRDGMVHVWDFVDGSQRFEVKLNQAFATSLAFSPTDNLLVIATNDVEEPLRLWNLDNNTHQVLPIDHSDRITTVEFSPDGTQLLTASMDDTAIVWNVSDQQTEHVLRGHTWWVWSASYSSDGRRIVTASQDGTVRIWNSQTGEQLTNERGDPLPFRGHQSPVHSARFSPNDVQVVSGDYDGRLILWNPEQLRSFDYRALIQDKPQPESRWREWSAHSAAISRVAFSLDGRWIISAGNDNLVKTWWAVDSAESRRSIVGTLFKSLRGHDSLVRDVVTVPNNADVIVSASYDGQLRYWSLKSYAENQVIPGVVLQGHSDAVLDASFSPDASHIVTASRDRTARVWDTIDGRPRLTLREGHAYLASTAVFLPGSDHRLLTAAVDGTARIWDVETGTQQGVLEGIGPSAAVAVAPNGRWIASSYKSEDSASAAVIWDAASAEIVHTLVNHKSPVATVAFSSDSQLLFTGDANGRGNIWDVETGRMLVTLRRHTGRISDAVFLKQDGALVTASEDRMVFHWQLPERLTSRDATSPLELTNSRVLPHPAPVTSIAVTPEGERMLTGCLDGVARMWNIADRSMEWQWSDDAKGILTAVDIAPTGSLALAVDTTHQWVTLLDTVTGQEIRRPSAQNGETHFLDLGEKGAIAWSASFAPDGRAIVTVGGDEARFWDLQGHEHLTLGPHRTIASAEYSPDGHQIATCSWDNTARIWNASDGRPLLKLGDHLAGDRGGHDGRVNGLAYAPDGKSLATASDDGTLRIWDTANGEVRRMLAGHQGPVLHVSYSPDGERIVSASRDATARVWSVKTGQTLRELSGHRLAVLYASFSSDGRRIATCGEDFRAIIWDAETGEALITLPEQTARVTSAAFSPTGTRLLTGGADRTIKVWDAGTGREILTLSGHVREVSSVSFSHDGRYVLSGSRDGTAIVWPAISHSADDNYLFDVPPLARLNRQTTFGP